MDTTLLIILIVIGLIILSANLSLLFRVKKQNNDDLVQRIDELLRGELRENRTELSTILERMSQRIEEKLKIGRAHV